MAGKKAPKPRLRDGSGRFVKPAAKKPRAKPRKKAKRGRPKKGFSLEQVEGLGSILATQEEMAAVFRCSVDTIQDRIKSDPEFSGALKRGQATAKINLKTVQKRSAVGSDALFDSHGNEIRPYTKPNPTMMIWLGKQWLGQKDKLTVDLTADELTKILVRLLDIQVGIVLDGKWAKELGIPPEEWDRVARVLLGEIADTAEDESAQWEKQPERLMLAQRAGQ